MPASLWPEFERLTAIETDDCVEWTGGCFTDGYGRIRFDGRQQATHRVALMLRCDPPAPDALALHAPLICHNRRCLNYRHLRWGTRKDNADDARVDGTTRSSAPSSTACHRGHPWEPGRRYASGQRYCPTCRRLRYEQGQAKSGHRVEG